MSSKGAEKSKNFGTTYNSKKKYIEQQPRPERSIGSIYYVSINSSLFMLPSP